MSTRTVRLDEETENLLAEIRQKTGMSISEALKRGLLTMRDEIIRKESVCPYDIYKELDLGPGGYAVAPSTEAGRGVKEAIERKLNR